MAKNKRNNEVQNMQNNPQEAEFASEIGALEQQAQRNQQQRNQQQRNQQQRNQQQNQE